MGADEPDQGTHLEWLPKSQHPATEWTAGTRVAVRVQDGGWEGDPVHFYRAAATLSKDGEETVRGTRQAGSARVCINQ